MTTLADALRAAIGAESVQDDDATRAAFRVQQMTPQCVATPATVEALQAVMRVATTHQASVAAWGGGTQQAIGAAPARLDLVVRMSGLNRVLAHTPDDLTISVEAGMPFAALREYLARHGQMLALDPPLPEQATIGGLIATATDGPRRLGYGTLRDVLIGITVVEADGHLSRGGGMVVKNVTGFDMMKLYLGSFGTLALIASANFKLLPLPRAAGSLLCRFATAAQAFAALDELDGTQLTPTAAEYLNDAAMARMGHNGGYGVALAAEGLPQAVERQLRDMAAIMRGHGATDIPQFADAAATSLWTGIANLPQTATLADNEAVLKFAVLPSDVAQLMAQIENQATRAGVTAVVHARALSGVAYARLQPVTPAALRLFASELPGLQWVATALPETPRWGDAPAGMEIMARIRAEFDSLGLLNPGRYIVAATPHT